MSANEPYVKSTPGTNLKEFDNDLTIIRRKEDAVSGKNIFNYNKKNA